MVAHGTQKLIGWFGGPGLDGTAAFFKAGGYPSVKALAILAGPAETGGGPGLVLGLLTPLGGAAVLVSLVNAIGVKGDGGFFAPAGSSTNCSWRSPPSSCASWAPAVWPSPRDTSPTAALAPIRRDRGAARCADGGALPDPAPLRKVTIARCGRGLLCARPPRGRPAWGRRKRSPCVSLRGPTPRSVPPLGPPVPRRRQAPPGLRPSGGRIPERSTPLTPVASGSVADLRTGNTPERILRVAVRTDLRAFGQPAGGRRCSSCMTSGSSPCWTTLCC
ncbi:DoxX family membrane protein [Streptomyces sp. SS7]|uniref:DoxX family protein n=1 Tax=Streptomyces sp. SS7 TaxID=3108485 RepID=UPI0030EF50DB